MLFILNTLIQWRRFILLAGFLTAVVMAAISLVLPKWYTASASVFPPDTQGAASPYADLMQSLQIPLFALSPGGLKPATFYVDILSSRRVGERVLQEFDLEREYDVPTTEAAVAVLQSHTRFTLLDNGLLKISFEDRDAERAAEVTNRFVSLLDEFNQEINVTRASKTKEFIQKQLDIHMRDLREAEEDLKRFKEEHQALELGEQIRSAIEVVTDLTAEAIALEVDLEILKQYASRSSEEFVRKKRKYDEVLDQLRKFKVDSTRNDEDLVRSFFPTFDKVPEVMLDLVRLSRRVQVEEKIYEMLIKEYEKSRIEEARDTPTIQVLDTARVPEVRSRPRRKILVGLGGILGLAWSSILAVFVTVWREQRAQSGMLSDLLSPVASDIKRFFRKKE
jgi:uncharacterized protein involved in exopolysaccharide biosynthesis